MGLVTHLEQVIQCHKLRLPHEKDSRIEYNALSFTKQGRNRGLILGNVPKVFIHSSQS